VALLDAASFFIAAALLAIVAVDGRATRTESAATPGATAWMAAFGEWVAGLALVRRDRLVALLVLFEAIAGIGEGVVAALFVPFVAGVLGGSEAAFGAILAAQAVGGLVGGAVIGQLGRGVPPARLVGLGALGVGAIDLVIFNAHRAVPGVLPPLILMVLVGVPAAAIGAGYATLLQTLVADEFRGRVFGSIGAVGSLSVLIGAGLAGALGDRLGIVATLTIDGATYLLAGTLVVFGFSGLFAKPRRAAAGR
jgi:Na+/melibiose symporter-like transporter